MLFPVLFIARNPAASDMQNKYTVKTDPLETGRAPCVPGLKRLFCTSLSGLMLSCAASSVHAAEMPQIIDAPIAASQTSHDGDSSSLIEIATIVSGQFRVARGESIAIAQAVLDAANRFTVSPVLLLGVIATESGFNRRAVSSAGARGLMQVLPSAHPQLVSGGKDLSDPVVNVTIGSSILRGYLDDAGGDLNSALARYSGGGKGYARRVALHMQEFSQRLHAQPDAFIKVALVESR